MVSHIETEFQTEYARLREVFPMADLDEIIWATSNSLEERLEGAIERTQARIEENDAVLAELHADALALDEAQGNEFYERGL